jgi:Cu(I)/Ag(I) efflux system membrane fusion protein
VKRVIAGAAAAAILAAAVGGFVVGHDGLRLADIARIGAIAPAVAQNGEQNGGSIIYYQDPDGKPVYSPTPKKTSDGRDYRAVPAGAEVNFDEPVTSAAQPTAMSSAADRKIKYYRNPMGLPDTSPMPKKDNMGMDYIPVYEGDDSDDGSVKLSPGKIQRTGVKSEPATRRILRTIIRAPGSIALDERRISVITMRSESFVQKVANVTVGTHVVKGQPLMEIYSPAISSASAEYVSTVGSATTARNPSYGSGSRQRLMNLDVPDAVISAMERSHSVPLAMEWTTPRDGIVLERNAVEGMRAQPGEVLFRIADHSLVWALVDVAERDLGALAEGQDVTVRARSFPGRIFAGKISVIYPEINKETRTARIRIDLPNPDYALLHGMYVDAEINTGSPDAVLTVPDGAVMDSGSRQIVLVDKGDGRFEPREVKIGHRSGGYVEIRAGVSEGEAVVVAANFLIDAESNLNAALKGFSNAGGQP